MKVGSRLARAATKDLMGISDYWTAKASPEVAYRIVSTIMENILLLTNMPELGYAADDLGAGVRKFLVGKYLIYYRQRRAVIEVLHLFHGARDQRKAWNVRSHR